MLRFGSNSFIIVLGVAIVFVGFLSTLIAILAPYFAGIIGVALIGVLSWEGAVLFTVLIFIVSAVAVIFNDKHTHLEYDDRLPSMRMSEARERYVEEVKERNVEN